VPIRPLQLYADGGYQLRIRRLEGTPNYGPRHYTRWWWKNLNVKYDIRLDIDLTDQETCLHACT
jgi:hypothetical protein